MTDETPIPNDIMQAADSVLEHAQMSAGWNPLVQRGLIARALMAERAKWEAELATLRAENERLREALRPFADAADIKLVGTWKDKEHFGRTDVQFHLTFGDLRRARAALKGVS